MISVKTISKVRAIVPKPIYSVLAFFGNFYYIFAYREPQIKKIDYDDYWGAREEEGVKDRDRIITELIDGGSSVLDVGCGDGRFLKYLSGQKKVKASGVDISKKAIEKAMQKGFDAKVGNIADKKYKIDRKYDYITMCEVIEHIPDPEMIMEKLKGSFRKNLIITVPNIGFIFHRLRLLFGRFPMDWYWHPGEHLRFWTRPDIRWWLTKANKGRFEYKIARMIPMGCPVLRWIWPNMFATGFVVVLE